MSASLIIAFLMPVIVVLMLSRSIRIAGESQRFAVFTLGRFDGYRGPGLIVVAPIISQVLRVAVGDTGTLISPEFVTIGNAEIPVTELDSLAVGSTIQIAGFDEHGPRFVPASVSQASRCPKCGHAY